MNTDDAHSRACLRFGWTALIVFALLGLTLEGLHLVKSPLYLEMRIRRELWTLAHAHGTLLALANIVFGLYLRGAGEAGKWRSQASIALRAAAVLMPLGFLLGGIGNPETDPSIAIVLVPVGAVLLIFAAYLAARSSWSATDQQPAPPPERPRGDKKGKRRRR